MLSMGEERVREDSSLFCAIRNCLDKEGERIMLVHGSI